MATTRTGSAWIVSPAYDSLGILLPPLMALGLGIALSGTAFATQPIEWGGRNVAWAQIAMGVMIHGHLVAVAFRSHGNKAIFSQHPVRFVAVPLALLIGMLVWRPVFIVAIVVATFWDVYHSGLQTFGFARIYDARLGNDPKVGRSLDWMLNHVLYAGPIFAGASMMDHVGDFELLSAIGSPLGTWLPEFMALSQPRYSPVIIAFGLAYLAFYLVAWSRLVQQGYRVSLQKVFLLVSTGFVSVYTWGFNSWGQAYLIMNFFHAAQYFAIVWATEGTNFGKLTGLENWGRAAVITGFLGISLGYGLLVELNTLYAFAAFSVVVSLMHFWYDGFVWSVRQRAV